MISKGFRRSQNILYNQVCENCNKCIPIRIKVNNFQDTKNQKRIINKGKLFERKVTEKATYEQFYLFKEYLDFKHPDSEMNDMIFADYYSMVKNTGIDTKIIEYRLDNVLVSSCITDFLDNALSMVYSFYSPYANKYSLGKYMILDHIKFGKKYKALRKPQKINVQFAPCQKPLTINIIIIFLIFFNRFPMLPPNGIYK